MKALVRRAIARKYMSRPKLALQGKLVKFMLSFAQEELDFQKIRENFLKIHEKTDILAVPDLPSSVFGLNFPFKSATVEFLV